MSRIPITLYLDDEEMEKFLYETDQYGSGEDAFVSFIVSEYLGMVELPEGDSDD